MLEADDTPLADRINMVYRGTTVVARRRARGRHATRATPPRSAGSAL